MLGLTARGPRIARVLSTTALCLSILPLQVSTVSAQEAASGGLMEEIMVTARKRVESLQNVPVAVSAFSMEKLENQNISDSQDLVGRVPGLFFSQNQSFGPTKSETYIVMRGVGATAALEPSVAVFLDGVYMPKMMFDVDFLDLQRMEILRGPQGALFGRNTQGGALNLVTRKPDNDFMAKAQVEVDEFKTFKVKGSISGALQEDKVFVAMSGHYERTDGYFDNLTLGTHQDDTSKGSFRTSLRVLPSEDLEVILVGAMGRTWGGQLGAGVPEGTKDWVVFDNDVRDVKDNIYNASLTLNWDLDFATLTSITGGVKTNTEVFWDWDGGPVATGNYQLQKIKQSIVSEELRLASNPVNKNFDWLTGVYLFKSVYDQDRDFGLVDGTGSTFPPIFDPNNIVDEQARFENEGFAVFGQATYRPFEKLDLTVGARYSREKVKSRQWGNVTVVGLGSVEIFDVLAEKTFSRFSPMGSISYRWTDDFMTYATIAEGFKAGGYQKYPASNLAAGTPFGNEISLNYEVGFKSTFLDGMGTLNVAAFIIKVSDQQLGTIREINGIPVEFIDNVGKSTNKGFEVETVLRPLEGLTLNGALSYVDAKFDEFFNPVTGRDRAGERVPYVPKWTGSAGAEYRHAVSDSADLVWGLEYRYVGSHIAGNGSPPFDPFLNIRSYDFFDAQVRLEMDNWQFVVFAENIFDEYNVSKKWEAPFQTTIFETPLAPRRLGLRITYNW